MRGVFFNHEEGFHSPLLRIFGQPDGSHLYFWGKNDLTAQKQCQNFNPCGQITLKYKRLITNF